MGGKPILSNPLAIDVRVLAIQGIREIDRAKTSLQILLMEPLYSLKMGL
jgi:hypothetical protein